MNRPKYSSIIARRRVGSARFLVTLAALLVLLAVALAPSASAKKVKTLTYKGTATSTTDETFKYGAVVVKIKSNKLTFLEVKSVTSSCSGTPLLRTHVFNVKDGSMKVTLGSTKVKNGKLVMTFKPVPDSDDWISLDLKVGKKKVTGTSTETGLCSGAAKLTAKR